VVPLSQLESKSGVAKTEYKVIDGSWQTYQGPFDVTAVGKIVVQYRSIDHVGNIQLVKSVT
jgi:hypothetical protein